MSSSDYSGNSALTGGAVPGGIGMKSVGGSANNS